MKNYSRKAQNKYIIVVCPLLFVKKMMVLFDLYGLQETELSNLTSLEVFISFLKLIGIWSASITY